MNPQIDFRVSRIFRMDTNGKIRAFVDLKINEAIVLRGLKVVEGERGLFVSMPQEQGKDSRWYDTVRCLSDGIREKINQCILDAYKTEMNGRN